ncbi:hypothetical protein LCI18_000040 [Fusarium solani-melongenae]|uniref:Uncharacterized protein n=1 Tax=Fusarium solani subsp. cucurbitae TaxID=2747967 RepID=A0ACD3YJL6_FUSSC|nr:hypothetical protein LCI18_000040 [Fusarium solani-melongenae]
MTPQPLAPESNQSDSETGIKPEPGHPRWRYLWWQSIGILGVLTLVVGTLIILASCATLIFLWKGADASAEHKEPKFWKTIVLNGWAPGTVTICSAAIRTWIALQLSLLVAALAAIMLEISGVCFGDIPLLSTQRASPSSPVGVLPTVIRRAARGQSGLIYSFIIITAVIVMLCSTFISTILLSDFRTRQIAALAMTRNLTIYLDDIGDFFRNNGASYWRSQSASQWRFAEAQVGECSSGDTGDTYRAMLPFSDESSRTSLEFYSGLAIVINLRTICFPLLLDIFSIVPGESKSGAFGFSGFSIKIANPVLRMSQKNNPERYQDCSLLSAAGNRTSWALSLCVDKALQNSNPLENLSDQKVACLILEKTENGTHVVPKNLWKLTSKSQGLWTTVYDANGLDVFTASVCYFNAHRPLRYQVTMSGRAIASEPTFTDDISLQLSSGNRSRESETRGILELKIGSPIQESGVPRNASIEPQSRFAFRERPDTLGSSWSMMEETTVFNPGWRAHRAHSSLFQRIIQEAGDPATAIQAFVTRIYQMIYYDWLQDYDFDYPTSTIHSTERLIPGQWTGFVIVLILIGVHLGLVFTTVAFFVLKTKASALGNSWQAVAQIAHMANVVESADRILDKEVDKGAKTRGLDKGVYYVSESVEGNRIEIGLRNRKRD